MIIIYDHKLLKRVYQNIDGLDEKSGIPSNHILSVHGIICAKCIDCDNILNDKQVGLFKLNYLVMQIQSA